MSEKKLDLIAQLLKKAESTTPEEAAALTAAAERLMVKYGIEQAAIDARRAKEGKTHEAIIEVKEHFTGLYRTQQRTLAASVAQALGLRVLQADVNKTAYMWLIGFEGDVHQAQILTRSLVLQGAVAMRAWWAVQRQDPWYARYASEYEKRRARGDFLVGFGQGAYERIVANRRQVVEEAGTGTELMLLDRGQQVDRWLEAAYGQIKTAKGSKAKMSAEARNAGIREGREANTGERAMGQGSRAIGAGR